MWEGVYRATGSIALYGPLCRFYTFPDASHFHTHFNVLTLGVPLLHSFEG